MFPGLTELRLIDAKNQRADILTKRNFTRDEWLQFVLKQWRKITTRFRRRTSHSEIETNDELYCKGVIELIILDVRKPGEEKLWKSKSLEGES